MSQLAGNRYSKLPKRGALQEKLQQIQKEEYHNQARFIVALLKDLYKRFFTNDAAGGKITATMIRGL